MVEPHLAVGIYGKNNRNIDLLRNIYPTLKLTLLGMKSASRLSQLSKAYFPIALMLSFIVTFLSDEQPLNTLP